VAQADEFSVSRRRSSLLSVSGRRAGRLDAAEMGAVDEILSLILALR